MEEKLISFETAKLSKEKGFDYAVMSYYSHPTEYKPELTLYNINEEDELDFRNWNKMDDFPWRYFSAPTQNFLQKWLRGKHNIHISIIFDENTANTYYFYKINSGDGFIKKESMHTFKTYEEALEIGLLTALKLIN